MIEKIKNFYFNYSPVFSERYIKNNVQFLFSKNVNDIYSNIAIIDNSVNLSFVNKEFEQRKLTPSYYSFNKISKNLKLSYTDDFLIFENIELLYKKFSKFKSKNIELIEVNNKQLQQEYMIINDKCYSAESYDNPYSNLDNFGYSKSVFDYQKNESETKTLVFIIRYEAQNVGCIILTIKNDLCYISGLAILKEFRKTKVFTVLIDVLKILINHKVKNIFCVTELNDYPDKLYKKIGFKSIANAYGYTK